nr:MAG TPA: hypothetical protein [Caudoviricetes sp.]
MTRTQAILRYFDKVGDSTLDDVRVGTLIYIDGTLAKVTSIGHLSTTEMSITFRKFSGGIGTGLLSSDIIKKIRILGDDTQSGVNLSEIEIKDIVKFIKNL